MQLSSSIYCCSSFWKVQRHLHHHTKKLIMNIKIKMTVSIINTTWCSTWCTTWNYICSFVWLELIATLNNISVISWRSVLLVEEAKVSLENHRPWTGNWPTLSCVMGVKLNPWHYLCDTRLTRFKEVRGSK